LSNIPHTTEDWAQWAWHHRDSHDRIRKAIKQVYGINLTDYQVEPINPNDLTSFLQNNSNLHDDMNTVLSLQSSDLQDANLQEPRELDAWIKLHAQEHYYAEAKLGAAIV
jgi:hypothetical protein